VHPWRKKNITGLSEAELVEKAHKHFQTCSYLISQHQERSNEGEAGHLLEYPSHAALLSIYAHLLLNIVEGVDSAEEQTRRAEQIGTILDLATQSLKENLNVKQSPSVESDINRGMALIGRIRAEASISSVDDEDLNNPLVITARADLKECEKLLQKARSLLDSAPRSYLVETKRQEISTIIKDLWSYIYIITDDEAEWRAIEDKANKEGFTLGDGDDDEDASI